LKVRLSLTAVLTAVLLAVVVPNASAAGSMEQDALSAAPGLMESADNRLDGNCTPPSDLAVCAAWHEEIRRNFAPREIGMLFGAATSYPEYVTSYSRIRDRYQRLRDDFATNNVSAGAVAIQ
jgi:hypothetical protein